MKLKRMRSLVMISLMHYVQIVVTQILFQELEIVMRLVLVYQTIISAVKLHILVKHLLTMITKYSLLILIVLKSLPFSQFQVELMIIQQEV